MGLFGKKPQLVNTPYVAPPSAAAPGPSMDEAIHDSELRTGGLQARLQALEKDIANAKREMQRSRPGTASHSMNKRRALQAMKQKKSLESRLNITSNATFNLEQVRDANYMQQDNVAMAQNLRIAKQQLVAGQQKLDLDEIEDLHDDMQEVLVDVNETQEILGRSYDVDNVDEAELEAELDELEAEPMVYGASDSLNTPSYLQPSAINAPATGTPAQGQLARPGYSQPEQMPAQRY